MTDLHGLRHAGVLVAWICARPAHCDRGRWYANIELAGVWRSDADTWPRYYFDLERAKLEVLAYLAAKGVVTAGAEWVHERVDYEAPTQSAAGSR